MSRVAQEMGSRIESGMDPDQACDEVFGVVEKEFGASPDWAAMLAMVLQLIALLSQLFNPPVPTTVRR